MKKYLLVFGVFSLLLCGSNWSQPFTFTRITPEAIMGDSADFEIVGYALLNPTSGSMIIRLRRMVEELTPSWDSLGTGICNYRNCYPPDRDTITEIYSSGPGDDSISLHFYCYSIFSGFLEGSGHVKLRAENPANLSQYIDLDFRAYSSLYIGIKQISTVVKDFTLGQNYPNPFNPVTKINFAIPKSEYVSLRVYDILGREVRILVNQNMIPGEYEVDFDARNLSSGIYYYSLRAGENVSVKKMVLVK